MTDWFVSTADSADWVSLVGNFYVLPSYVDDNYVEGQGSETDWSGLPAQTSTLDSGYVMSGYVMVGYVDDGFGGATWDVEDSVASTWSSSSPKTTTWH